jgi:O-antigen ligase
LRRLLVLGVTGLLVARPLVPGEDPGLLRSVSGPSGMVLTLCWLAVGVGWALWRLWSGRGEWYVGLVEVALLVAAACVFVSAETAAGYKHPARLIAWEWFGLLLTFCLIRQLATSPDERQGLFAALLASGVTLAAQAVYQSVARSPPVAATYSSPDSLAVFLVLILPALAWTAVLYHSSHGPAWTTALAGVFALLVAAAVGLTYRVPAYLAVVVVGLPAAILTYRSWRGQRYVFLGVLAVLIAANWGVVRGFLVPTEDSLSETTARWDTWRSTWRMIEERPWWGWGPGNFGRAFPRFMDETAVEAAATPHSFVLEVWATSGPFAVLAVLGALAVFFAQILRPSLSREPPASAGAEKSVGPTGTIPFSPVGPTLFSAQAGASASRTRRNDISAHPQPIRWEYYLGGTLGLLLGLVLRVQERGPADILPEGFLAAGRSVLWFGAFALFERAPWTDRGRALALAAGVAGALVVLTFADGIGYPSVAGLLWAAVALGLSSTDPRPVGWLSHNGVALALPLPALAGVALAYFLMVFMPVAASASQVQEGFRASAYYFLDPQKHPAKWGETYSKKYVQDMILPHFQKAAEADPTDARNLVHQAIWTGETFAKEPTNVKYAQDALIWARKARVLDPEGPTGYETQYSLHAEFAKIARSQADKAEKARDRAQDEKKPDRVRLYQEKEITNRHKAQTEWRSAARALSPYLAYAPTDPLLRYQLAEALYRGEDWPGLIEQGEEALRLNAAAPRPRKLPDKKVKTLEVWLEVARHYQALEPRSPGG